MFDLGWSELVLIGIVALIVIGPKELPTVLRTLGTYMGKVKRMASEFQGQFSDALREAELHDLQKQAQDLTSSVTDISSFDPMSDPLADTKQAIDRAWETPDSKPKVETDTPAALEAPSGEPPPIDVPPPAKKSERRKRAAPAKPPTEPAGGGA